MVEAQSIQTFPPRTEAEARSVFRSQEFIGRAGADVFTPGEALNLGIQISRTATIVPIDGGFGFGGRLTQSQQDVIREAAESAKRTAEREAIEESKRLAEEPKTLIPGSAQVPEAVIPDVPVKRSRPFSLDERPSTSVLPGMFPIVTQAESERLRRQGVPETFITAQDVTPAQAIEEGVFLSGLGLRRAISPTIVQPSGAIVFNIQQVIDVGKARKKFGEIKTEFAQAPESFIGREGVTVKEDQFGKEISLGEEFFAKEFKGIFDTSKKEALESFKALPRRVKVPSIITGGVIGITQFGIGALEFGGTLATSLAFKPIEKIEWFGGGFKFGGAVGEIATLPKGAAEFGGMGIGALPFVFTGVSSAKTTIKELGFKKGALELGGQFTPFRISPASTSVSLEGVKFDKGVAFEFQEGGKITTQFIGKSRKFPDVRILSETISVKGGGTTTEIITSPTFQFRGGELTSGIETRQFATQFIGKGFGTIGFEGTAKTVPVFRTLVFDQKAQIEFFKDIKPTTTEFFGLREKFPGTENVFGFVSGRRGLDVFDISGGKATIIQPKGFFRPQVSGLGLTFKGPPAPKPSGVNIFRGGRLKTPFAKTFAPEVLTKQVTKQSFQSFGFPGISGATTTTFPKVNLGIQKIIPGAVPGVVTPSLFGGRGLIVEDTLIGGRVISPGRGDLLLGGARLETTLRLPIISPGRIRARPLARFKPRTLLGTGLGTGVIQLPSLATTTRLDITLRQPVKLRQELVQTFPSPTTLTPPTGFGFDFGFIPPPVPFLFPPLAAFRGTRRPRRRGRKARAPRISPAFTSIVFDIEGILPTGREFFQGEFGVIPLLQPRRIPKRRKVKKKAKRRKKKK